MSASSERLGLRESNEESRKIVDTGTESGSPEKQHQSGGDVAETAKNGRANSNNDGHTPITASMAEAGTNESRPEPPESAGLSNPATSVLEEKDNTTMESSTRDESTDSEMAGSTTKLSLEDAANSKNQALEPVSLRDKPGVRSPSPPPLPPKDDKLVNQKDQETSVPPQSEAEIEYNEKHPREDDTIADPQEDGNDSKSEIQSIMDQFEAGGTGPGMNEIMSPRLEKAQPVFPPPRSSSLDPVQSGLLGSPAPLHRTGSRESYSFRTSSIRPSSISGASIASGQQGGRSESIAPPSPSSASVFQPPPPSPDPEPTLPFDFHRFLEQLRHRTADPVARFLRSFLLEFGKKQWMVHEQVKIISDFLEFISKKMSQCEVWRTVSDAEFDNAREGMEKLVMNRLYSQTFSPAIPPSASTPVGKTRRKAQPETSQGMGRRGQHQEDVERDEVIAQKIRIYGWIKEEHLDMPPVGDKGRKFLVLAQQELLKINSYRAPRDKVICVLNCCKVIFGYLKNSQSDQSADSFVPLLIYTILRANPEHLASNVQYILRFRNQDKLGGEAGYYISSLMGVVSFVENLDRTNLTITDEEFERNVEAAVSAITEGHKAEEYEGKTHATSSQTPSQMQLQEKSSLSRPQVTPRNSMEAERSTPRRNVTAQLGSGEKVGSSISSGDGGQEENAAVSGLLRTIQKPLSTIGRMFSDEGPNTHPVSTPVPGATPRLTPVPNAETRSSGESHRQGPGRPQSGRTRSAESRTSAQDAAARQASAETAEAQRIREQEHRVVVE